jgi:hypothetical protein
LQKFFRIASEFFQFVVRLLRPGKLHQLYFLKLMLANNSAHVLPIGTGFAAEAWGVGRQRDGQA